MSLVGRYYVARRAAGGYNEEVYVTMDSNAMRTLVAWVCAAYSEQQGTFSGILIPNSSVSRTCTAATLCDTHAQPLGANIRQNSLLCRLSLL